MNQYIELVIHLGATLAITVVIIYVIFVTVKMTYDRKERLLKKILPIDKGR